MKFISRIIYISIFIFSAIYVFKHQKYSKPIGIKNGYAVDFSVNRGNNVEFYLNAEEAHKKGLVYIYDLKGQKRDSIILPLISQKKITDTLFYEHGYNYTNKLSYNTKNLKSGLYLIGNVVPFIVREPNLKKNITVVFPYANMQAINNEGGKSFLGNSSSHKIPATVLSLHRDIVLNDFRVTFLEWIDSLYGKKNINIITDIDLEDDRNINSTELMIIYGYSAFWSLKMRLSFNKFQMQGGNVLAICTSFMNYKYIYDRSKRSIMYDESIQQDNRPKSKVKTGQWINSEFRSPNITSTGCSYEIYYETSLIKPSFGGIRIVDKSNPIFRDIKDSTIRLNLPAYNSIMIINPNSKSAPLADLSSGNFYEKRIIGYDYGIYNFGQTIGGIYFMRKTKMSGQMIVIGCESWCHADNFNKKDIQTITNNCVKYLKR